MPTGDAKVNVRSGGSANMIELVHDTIVFLFTKIDRCISAYRTRVLTTLALHSVQNLVSNSTKNTRTAVAKTTPD